MSQYGSYSYSYVCYRPKGPNIVTITPSEKLFIINWNSKEQAQNNVELNLMGNAIVTRALYLSCKGCPKSFKGSNDLNNHLCRVNDEIVKCSKCLMIFPNNCFLKIHQNNFGHYNAIASELVLLDTELPLKSEMMIRANDNDGKYQCDKCQRFIYNKANFKWHVRYAHSDVRPFECSDCKKRYKSTVHLKKHRSQVHSGHRLVCPQCPKTFSHKWSLQQHILAKHINLKPFICDQCGRRFNKNANMLIHRARHENYRRFLCEQCGKGFLLKQEWQLHMSKHSDNVCYFCECGDKFISKVLLVAHIKYDHQTQTEPKKTYKDGQYSCDSGQSFLREDFLKKHCKKPHGVQKVKKDEWSCKFCTKVFHHGMLYRRHPCPGRKTYHCKLCLAVYKTSTGLYGHMTRKHVPKESADSVIKDFHLSS